MYITKISFYLVIQIWDSVYIYRKAITGLDCEFMVLKIDSENQRFFKKIKSLKFV